MARSSVVRADVVDVRLALRWLLPHCPERSPLELLWNVAGQDNEIGRAQSTTAAFNGIVRRLRSADVMKTKPQRAANTLETETAFD